MRFSGVIGLLIAAFALLYAAFDGWHHPERVWNDRRGHRMHQLPTELKGVDAPRPGGGSASY